MNFRRLKQNTQEGCSGSEILVLNNNSVHFIDLFRVQTAIVLRSWNVFKNIFGHMHGIECHVALPKHLLNLVLHSAIGSVHFCYRVETTLGPWISQSFNVL